MKHLLQFALLTIVLSVPLKASPLVNFDKVAQDFKKSQENNNLNQLNDWKLKSINALWKDWNDGNETRVAEKLLSHFNSFESLNKTITDYPIVRIEIINILGNAVKLCAVNIEREVLRKELVKYNNKDDVHILISYVSALGSVGDATDFPMLESIILSEYPGLSYMAIDSVLSINSPEAASILKKVLPELKGELFKKYINERLTTYTYEETILQCDDN